jgi:hypothetical protein
MFLTLLHFMVAMDFVSNHAADRAYARTNDCAARTANLRSNKSSANGAAGYELGLGLVVMVVSVGLRCGVFVRLLRDDCKRHGKHGGGNCGGCKCFDGHVVSRKPACGRWMHKNIR